MADEERTEDQQKQINRLTATEQRIDVLIARIDERTSTMNDMVRSLQRDIASFTLRIDEKIEKLRIQDTDYYNKMMEHVEKYYVKKVEFNPVRLIAYGIISLVGTVIVGALLGLIIKL